MDVFEVLTEIVTMGVLLVAIGYTLEIISPRATGSVDLCDTFIAAAAWVLFFAFRGYFF